MMNSTLEKIRVLQDEKLNLDIDIVVIGNLKKEVTENKEVSSLILNLIGKYDKKTIAGQIGELQKLLYERNVLKLAGYRRK